MLCITPPVNLYIASVQGVETVILLRKVCKILVLLTGIILMVRGQLISGHLELNSKTHRVDKIS